MTRTFTYVGTVDYRAYYRRNETRALYCIQNEGSWGVDRFVFNLCSRDGEPQQPAEMPDAGAFDKLIYPPSLSVAARQA